MYRRSKQYGEQVGLPLLPSPHRGQRWGSLGGSRRILWEVCGVSGQGQRQIPHSSDVSQQPTCLPATRSRALCGQLSAPDNKPDTWLYARNTYVFARFYQGLLPCQKADSVRRGCAILPTASSDASSQQV